MTGRRDLDEGTARFVEADRERFRRQHASAKPAPARRQPTPSGYTKQVGERVEVSVESYNGRPRVRLRDLRFGGWFLLDVADLANASAALDDALTWIVTQETARR